MKISYLREFVVAAKTANFTKAARILNMTQPVLSKHMAVVERSAGVELFERSTNPITLTPHGRLFLEDAQRILVDYDASIRRMKSLRHVEPTTVKVVAHVGCKHSDDLISRAILKLSRTHPLVNVDVHNASVISPVADVLEGGADVAVVSDKGIAIADLSDAPLFEEPLCAVVRRGHRLASLKSASPSDLAGEVVWASFAAPVARHYLAVRDLLEERGAEAQFAELPFHGTPSALELSFERGVYVDGAGVIEHSLSFMSLSKEFTVVPLSGDATLNHRALYREGEARSAVRAFVDALKDAVSDADMSLYWETAQLTAS